MIVATKKQNPAPVRHRQRLHFIYLALAIAFLSPGLTMADPAPDLVIDARLHNVGKRVDDTSDRPRLDLPFSEVASPTNCTLLLTHSNVSQPWFVECNGRRIGELPLSYGVQRQSYFSIPADALRKGSNTLSIVADNFGREIAVGNCFLFRKPLGELLHLRPVTVTVTDGRSRKPVPARLTIVDDSGHGAQIFAVSSTNTAVRTGVIYTTGEQITFEIPQGRYDFYATRGMEWSLGHKKVSLSSTKTTPVRLAIRRQVDTTGFIAADTHIHTLTFSGHGDASIYERMLSLAGEGVELAVATDHNHHTDYAPYQGTLGLNEYFTPVTGNEVTTKNGHLNAFPMPPAGALPDHRQSDWVKLVRDIRLKGAKVVILNHPRWPDLQNSPLAKFQFNRASGDRFQGPAFTFDAMELVNSSSSSFIAREEIKANVMRLLTDWFAIQNRGEKITGVGASDSHTIDNPVGQGRTYIRSYTDDPTRLDVDELCENFLAGDTSVSYGIFADVTVDQRQHMGNEFRPKNGKMDVCLRVASADWITPRRAIVFLNGLPVAEKKLQPKPGKAFDKQLRFSITAPVHDAYLVCAVFGDGITAPCWETLANFTAAVTNPLYVDADGDGEYQSPRKTAQKLLESTSGDLANVWKLLEESDDAFAGQMLGILSFNREASFLRELHAKLVAAAPKRQLYQTFLETAPEPK